MATSPSRVRAALQRVTGAARAEVRAVAAAASKDPADWRAALFATAPLIVSEYSPASATLGLDWFEEIRSEANPSKLYTPTPRLNVTDEDVTAMVARVTAPLYQPETDLQADIDKMMSEALALLEAEIQKEAATGFWDTITENADEDPEAAGWQRFARPGACKFCLMLSDRGAVYTETSVRFAAHTSCHCVAGPSYDKDAPKVGVIQYVASSKRSKDEEVQAARNAKIREYLNHNFPDARG